MSFDSMLNEALDKSMVDVLSESQLKAIGRQFIRSSELEELLSSHNIPHMIIGAHALGEVTSEPRATQDVDIIVRNSDYDKVIKIITNKYGVEAEGNRIKDKSGNVLVDILTDSHPIYKTAMDLGGRIPDPEMILVMKFLSSVSPLRRKDKKLQDKADFFNVVSKVDDIDEQRVIDLLKKADPEYVLHADEIVDWIKDAK